MEERRALRRKRRSGQLYSGSRRRWSSMMFVSIGVPAAALCLSALSSFSILWTVTAVADESESGSRGFPDWLSEESVVLITGAAGFIGSELAMALHRTYGVKKLLCIDSMSSLGLVPASVPNSGKESDGATGNSNSKGLTEEELALFEFKRQRVFHLLQTVGPKAHFYRSDFRPSIPEYFDVGEVPLLDTIFRDHPDITHVVHLADAYHAAAPSSLMQAVPRVKDDIKSGMIEAIFEQLLKVRRDSGVDTLPHFVYASSYEVYNHLISSTNNPNPPPFREDGTITTPSSLRGATKLIDEILARTYNRNHAIFSLGLRFFPVYGPWGPPGTPLFEMSETAVSDPESPILFLTNDEAQPGPDDVRDYVYIDDAIDAIMAAMQFRPPPSSADNIVPNLVVNVGTGEGNTLSDIAKIMETHFPRAAENEDNVSSEQNPTISYASTDRAKALLGFQARVPLREGLSRLLAWHYDRAFPYGGRPSMSSPESEGETDASEVVSAYGVESCIAFDSECLKGAPVFPCTSECSNIDQCTPSSFDGAARISRSLTSACVNVMYTVSLGDDVATIPSADITLSPDSIPYVDNADGGKSKCNVAFVSENSILVKRLKREMGIPLFKPMTEDPVLLAANGEALGDSLPTFGFWTIIPVSISSMVTDDAHVLRLLPKLSPGFFFSSTTQHAIFADPNVAFKNVPRLLAMAQMQPLANGRDGATAMLAAAGDSSSQSFSFQSRTGATAKRQKTFLPDTTKSEALQRRTYNMIRVGMKGIMPGGGHNPIADTSWLVHTLGVEDARLFRCDIFGEVVQWEVGSDEQASEFVIGLHDAWSRLIVRWSGSEPWWTGQDVKAGPEADSNQPTDPAEGRRRLTNVKSLKDREKLIDDASKTEGRKENDDKQEGKETSTGARNHDTGIIMSGNKNEKTELWFGALSSTNLHYFVRIIPSSEADAVILDG